MVTRGDSYCGIYCGACSVSRHGDTGQGDAFISCLGSVPGKELACGGCKSEVLYAGCRICKLRDCARAKGIAHCGDCADYPCGMYRSWRWLGGVLPHVRETADNLAAIRDHGLDAWLAAQERRWACPACGERFSWYAVRCGACGRDVAAAAHALSGIRKLVCSWLLPVAYRKGRARE